MRHVTQHLAARVALGILMTVVLVVLTLLIWGPASPDLIIYRDDARAFLSGTPPFTAFPREYPPLALVPFSLTLLTVNPILSFALGCGFFFFLSYLGFLRFSTPANGWRYLLYVFVGGQALIFTRYDLFPMLATLGALWATERRRFPLAMALLALGALLKLYPLVLVPVVLIAQWHDLDEWPLWRDRLMRLGGSIATFVIIAGGGALIAYLRNPEGTRAILSFASDRPVQVESFAATIVWFGTFLGVPAHTIYAYGSDNLVGPLASALVVWSSLATVLACGAIYLFFLQRRLSTSSAMLGVLCALLLTSKVLSAQYLLWALPFVAESESIEPVWLVIGALTTIELAYYPFNDPAAATKIPIFLGMMALRNLLLLYATIRLVRRSAPVPAMRYTFAGND